MACPISQEIKKDRAIDSAVDSGVGDRRLRSEGIRLDSAPDIDTLPISSWLKRAMQLTFPSSVATLADEAKDDNASTAQKLEEHISGNPWKGSRNPTMRIDCQGGD